MARILITTDDGEILSVLDPRQTDDLRKGLEVSPMSHGEDVLAQAIWAAQLEDDAARFARSAQVEVFDLQFGRVS